MATLSARARCSFHQHTQARSLMKPVRTAHASHAAGTGGDTAQEKQVSELQQPRLPWCRGRRLPALRPAVRRGGTAAARSARLLARSLPRLSGLPPACRATAPGRAGAAAPLPAAPGDWQRPRPPRPTRATARTPAPRPEPPPAPGAIQSAGPARDKEVSRGCRDRCDHTD